MGTIFVRILVAFIRMREQSNNVKMGFLCNFHENFLGKLTYTF